MNDRKQPADKEGRGKRPLENEARAAKPPQTTPRRHTMKSPEKTPNNTKLKCASKADASKTQKTRRDTSKSSKSESGRFTKTTFDVETIRKFLEKNSFFYMINDYYDLDEIANAVLDGDEHEWLEMLHGNIISMVIKNPPNDLARDWKRAFATTGLNFVMFCDDLKAPMYDCRKYRGDHTYFIKGQGTRRYTRGSTPV